MRITLSGISLAAVLLFGSLAEAQFLELPQSQNGTILNYFAQATISKSGATAIVGVTNLINETAAAKVSVLFTNGTGGFGTPITTALSGVDTPTISQLLLGDFNDDGNVDVAIFGKDHTTGASAVAVMLGNGDGTFQAGKEGVIGGIGLPSDVCGIAAGDYNDDNKLDIVYVAHAGSSSTLIVLPGNGDGIRRLATNSNLTSEEKEAAVRAERFTIMLLREHDAAGHNGKRCPFSTLISG